MNNVVKIINKFIRDNPEFSAIRKTTQGLIVILKGSEFEYKVKDFSLNSQIRQKLESLEKLLGMPVS